MSVAAVIPTFVGHFARNISFLQSVVAFNEPDTIPDIVFVVTDEAEHTSLRDLLSQFPKHLTARIQITVINDFDLFSKSHANAERDSLLLDRKIALINFKKFFGVQFAFTAGFESVVLLDSEIIQFRPCNLKAALGEIAGDRSYRASYEAYRAPLLAKIQHDSIRSAHHKYDTSLPFSISYGWYDNLCVYEKKQFQAFSKYFPTNFKNSALNIVAHMRGYSFDWITYKAWCHLVNGEELKIIDLDLILKKHAKVVHRLPQTESLYQYLSGEFETDVELLKVFNPRWLPYTDDPEILTVINSAVSAANCLMFHADRSHPCGKNLSPPPDLRKTLRQRLRGRFRKL